MSRKSNFFAAFAALYVLTTGAATMAQAVDGSLIQPVDAQSSGGVFATLDESKLYDQNGLSAPYTSGVTLASSAASTTHIDTAFTEGWASDQPGGFSPFFLSFDLGAAESISALRLWSTTVTTAGARGDVEDFEVFSDNDFDPTNGGLTSLGSFTAADQTGNDRPAEDFALNLTTSRYFHFQINSNRGDINNVDSTRTSLGEVAFITVSAIPEPAALMLLTAMTGGLMTRRRRKPLV
jgi:hypothetical protein